MKLRDLNPKWVGAGGEGIYNRNEAGELVPAPRRHGVGVSFDCPCGGADCLRVFVHINPPLDGGPVLSSGVHWERSGDDFDSLTLSPSLQRMEGCRWHGWVRNGEVISC